LKNYIDKKFIINRQIDEEIFISDEEIDIILKGGKSNPEYE